MSADNGIYIGCFPTESGNKEYRVIYAMAIDNVFCRGLENNDKKIEDAYRASYFGEEKSFATEDEARKEALNRYYSFMDQGGHLEYGISVLKFDRPLVKMTDEEIKKVLDW